MIVSSFLLNNKTENLFKVGFKKNSGRNSSGQITVRHKINKTHKLYYSIDFFRSLSNKLAIVVFLKNDPNRNCIIALIKYSTGSYSYILAPHGVINGYFLKSTSKVELSYDLYKIGYSVFLYNLPLKSLFFNLKLNKTGSKYAISAGVYCVLISSDEESKVSKIRLPSNKIIFISNTVLVTLGRSSNIFKEKEVAGKAGRNIYNGFKSIVRGVAMNPVDHPHGGRTKTNSPELTP
jgi:large subunit ribosomal protein L2